MYDYTSSYTEKITEHYQEQMNQILSYKLMKLEEKALRSGEYNLYEILKELDIKNIEKTRLALEEQGYSIELVQPQPLLTSDEGSIKVTIEMDKVKLIVKKKIFEI